RFRFVYIYLIQLHMNQSFPEKISIIDGNNFYALGIKCALQSIAPTSKSEVQVFRSATEYLSSEMDGELVLLNIMLPDIGGIKLCQQIKLRKPEIKVIILSMSDDEQDLANCLAAMADGFLFKDFSEKELEFAMFKVFSNSRYIDAELVLKLTRKSMQSRSEEKSLNEFEMTLLQYISDQMKDLDIVEKMKMPRGKLSYYKRKLYKKLDVKNSAGLIKKAVSLKLVS
ncbi:MAG TPA: response regulator, partial [Bacteroidia bacterium]